MDALIHPSPGTRRRRAAPVRVWLGLALTLGLAACGGGNDEPASTLPSAGDITASQRAIDGPLAALPAVSGLPSADDIAAAQAAIDAGSVDGALSADAITSAQAALDDTAEFD